MNRKYLKKSELPLVDVAFRKIVKEAFQNKEKVPYGIIFLRKRKLSEADIKKAKELISKINES